MSNVLHWTPEQLEAYRLRLGGRPEKPAHRERSGQKGEATPKAPPRACAESDPSALPDYRPSAVCAVPLRAAGGKQTKTEEKYNRECLAGRGRFEAVTLHLPGGGRYTPDFMTVDDGVVTFHEVKGSYRLGSQGRAYTAFHEAAAYYPMWRFVWAHWTGKTWDVSTIAEDGDLTGAPMVMT